MQQQPQLAPAQAASVPPSPAMRTRQLPAAALPVRAPGASNTLDDFKAEMRAACQTLNAQYNARAQAGAGSTSAGQSNLGLMASRSAAGRLTAAQQPAGGVRPGGSIATPMPGGMVRRCTGGGASGEATSSGSGGILAASPQLDRRVLGASCSTRMPLPPNGSVRPAGSGESVAAAPSTAAAWSLRAASEMSSPSASAPARMGRLPRAQSASLFKPQPSGSCTASPASVTRELEGLRLNQTVPPCRSTAAASAGAPSCPSPPTADVVPRGSQSDIVRPRPLDRNKITPFPEERLLELIPSPEFTARPTRVWTGVPGVSTPGVSVEPIQPPSGGGRRLPASRPRRHTSDGLALASAPASAPPQMSATPPPLRGGDDRRAGDRASAAAALRPMATGAEPSEAPKSGAASGGGQPQRSASVAELPVTAGGARSKKRVSFNLVDEDGPKGEEPVLTNTS